MYKLKCVSQRFFDNLSIVRPSDPASEVSFDLNSRSYCHYQSDMFYLQIINLHGLYISCALSAVLSISPARSFVIQPSSIRF